uniref:Nck-associated protein 5 C-terminal domain-containing protein n=1 Tax=Periophthalmus magnuspinnatus TaxID=409849 RepID=A0A3B4AAS3_9GOBI
SEKRVREVTEESEHGRAHMVSLQQQFSRMEETVRSLLQNQGLEQTAVDTVDLMKAYKVLTPPWSRLMFRCFDAQNGVDLDVLVVLQEQNSALAIENENQREQYERCLDEVANQVVQALLTQKDLREECVKLRTRVFDLEQQNRALSVLFQQKIKPASDLLLQVLSHTFKYILLYSSIYSLFLMLLQDVPVNGKAGGFSVTKCVSQLSLTAPERPLYPRSSCSSSEISLSSACSDFSSGSYTWNDGRSTGKMVIPVLNEENKRCSLMLYTDLFFIMSCCHSSSCQMRTLDSGIGTFPLPKSESCGPVTAMTSDPASSSSSSQPDDVTANAAPPTSRLGHSLSDPTVTRCNVQSRLPKLSTSGKYKSAFCIVFFYLF